jgi:cold-inducible RNA-binding protein
LQQKKRKNMSDYRQEEPNKKKLFVGNLPFSTTQEELQEVFSKFGEIANVNLITDRMSGRPKGFAFIEMNSEEEAQAAIDGMSGQKIGDREVIVNLARPRQPRDNQRGGFGGQRNYGANRSGGRSDRY